MSLLLEALKKAEKAKEEAQRRAKGGDAAESQTDPDATIVDPGKHVMTRAELPDISAPLEILSEDIRPRAPSEPALATLSLVEEPAPAPEPKLAPRREAPRTAAAAPAADAMKSERATAQKVFEAKFKEPDPRLPFYIAVGALTLFGLGVGIYFWMELRPPPALVNTNPPPSGEKPVAVAEQKPAGDAGGSQAQSAPAQPAIPGLPGAPAAQAPVAATSAPAAPAASAPAPVPAPAPSAAPAPASAPASAPVTTATAPPAVTPKPPVAATTRAARVARASAKPAAAAKGGERAVTVNRGGPQIHTRVTAGYAAYQAGDLATARNEYQQVLREEPSNRDAMLGLAAVEMRAQRYDLADAQYQRLLQANPRDPHAQAGMLALRSQQIDPVQTESRVKSLLAGDRDATVLYFTLGNQYAQQGRWAEAQQAYSKAYAADPGNPDFAFNVAVSLDQLRQPKLALEYYQRALALAEKRAASFSAETAHGRVQQLSR